MKKNKYTTPDGKRLYAPGKEPGYKRKVFIKLAKHARKTLKKSGVDISWNEAQKFTSAYLYADYKDELLSNISNKEVESVVIRSSKPNVPIREIIESCGSVFKVPISDYTAIDWYDIGNSIRLIANDVKIRINGGDFGVSKLDKAETFDYHTSGIADIVERIREFVNNDSSPMVVWEGDTYVVPGYKDDANECSYFIDFILNIDGVPVGDSDKERVDAFELMSEEEELERQGRKKEAEALRKKRIKKKKEDEEARRLLREQQETSKNRERPTGPPPEKQKQDLKGMLELLRQDYNDGIYDKDEYKTERQRLIDKFE